MSSPPSLDEVPLNGDRKQAMGAIHKVRPEPKSRRNVLDAPPSIRQGGLSRIAGESVPSASQSGATARSGRSARERLGGGGRNELTDHRGGSAGALHEFDGRDDGVLLYDDTAFDAYRSTGLVVLLNVLGAAVWAYYCRGGRS